MSIVTKTGDAGETGLLYGGRVSKDDLHTEAYGALDEAISALGLARALDPDAGRTERVLELQRELFVVGAELATGPGHRVELERHFNVVTPAMVEALHAWVTRLEDEVQLPQGFVVPGGPAAAAAYDVARTLIRRAERRAVSLHRAAELENREVLRYLNRCSDLLFMLARQAEQGATTPTGSQRRT